MFRRMLRGLALLGALTLPLAPAAADEHLDTGKKAFNRCKACHTLEEGKHRVGPSLHGLFGREAGTVQGFTYSEAM